MWDKVELKMRFRPREAATSRQGGGGWASDSVSPPPTPTPESRPLTVRDCVSLSLSSTRFCFALFSFENGQFQSCLVQG